MDLLLTGESAPSDGRTHHLKISEDYAGKTFAYNRPLFAERVRDTVASIAITLAEPNVSRIQLVGTGEAAPVVLLAATQLRGLVHEVVVDLEGKNLSQVQTSSDPLFLPGALKYGGLGGLAALAAPVKLTLGGTRGLSTEELAPLQSMYTVESAPFTLTPEGLTDEQIAEKLLSD